MLRGHGIVAANISGMDNNYYYHQDEQGSTAIITDENADIKNSYHYDAFGKILESQETLPNRITYTGQQYDPLTQQYYLRARYYNPIIGRFTQEDTYRSDGLNLYAYCSNNPVSYYDPSGYVKQASPPCKAPAVTDADGGNAKVLGDISRTEALGQIKQDLGIPKTQHPDSQEMVMLLDEYDMPIVENCEFVYSRELTYSVLGKTDAGGNPIKQVIIQDHSYGHAYSSGIGNQPSHFNVRPDTKPRNGGVSGTKDHYYFTYRNQK